MPKPTIHTISRSDGVLLRLTDDEYKAFDLEYLALCKKYYIAHREKFGIWAGNQDKYVSDKKDLGPWDSDFMENLANA